MTALRESAAGTARVRQAAPPPAAEPFADLQWDMRMINATPPSLQAPARQPRGARGDHRHRHRRHRTPTSPQLRPGAQPQLHHGHPAIDGPCEEANCKDPADVDQDGHGTHVAGTIGAAINGLGMAGVAPGVDLINIRAGQDSGYFFLQPSVDALTYAGDNGVDVVNMSYYIDPWLYNCADNPADTPEEQLEQRTIIAATERALAYARRHGVTLVPRRATRTPTSGSRPRRHEPGLPAGHEYGRMMDN